MVALITGSEGAVLGLMVSVLILVLGSAAAERSEARRAAAPPENSGMAWAARPPADAGNQ